MAFRRGMHSGIVLSDTSIKDVIFEGAKLNLANLRIAKLRRVRFVGCDLTEADFQGADMQSVAFVDCDLSRAEFAGCKMKDVDLRGSDISTIRGVAGLKGGQIDTAQLISISQVMAAELGLVVEES